GGPLLVGGLVWPVHGGILLSASARFLSPGAGPVPGPRTDRGRSPGPGGRYKTCKIRPAAVNASGAELRAPRPGPGTPRRARFVNTREATPPTAPTLFLTPGKGKPPLPPCC